MKMYTYLNYLVEIVSKPSVSTNNISAQKS